MREETNNKKERGEIEIVRVGREIKKERERGRENRI